MYQYNLRVIFFKLIKYNKFNIIGNQVSLQIIKGKIYINGNLFLYIKDNLEEAIKILMDFNYVIDIIVYCKKDNRKFIYQGYYNVD